MKTLIASKVTILFAALFLFLTGVSKAQTIEEAFELFTQSRTLISEGKNQEAITTLESLITMCDQLGEEGDELKNNAVSVLPNLYYNSAKELFDLGQLDAAIEGYEKTLAVASMYNDQETYNLTRSVLAQLFLKSGNDKFREREFEAALVDLGRALEYDPTNTNTLLLLAYCHRRLENTAEMVFYFNAVIANGRANERNVTTSRDALMTHFMNTGARLINAKNTAEGLPNLDTAATFGESADLWYYYAVGFNAAERHPEAIEAAEKSISLEPNNRENVARNQFEIGTAWYGQSNNPKACEAYSAANFGRTAARADQMIKALRCR
jgi:tetratricopeptide (TPR) repeat protein